MARILGPATIPDPVVARRIPPRQSPYAWAESAGAEHAPPGDRLPLSVPGAKGPTPQVSNPSSHCSLPFPLFFITHPLSPGDLRSTSCLRIYTFSLSPVRGNHIIFVLWCQAYFAWHNVFKVHLCCNMSYNFTPFLQNC